MLSTLQLLSQSHLVAGTLFGPKKHLSSLTPTEKLNFIYYFKTRLISLILLGCLLKKSTFVTPELSLSTSVLDGTILWYPKDLRENV